MFKKLVAACILMSGSIVAQASDHGCQVLLCLANPGGPTKVAECVPPIKKLLKDLAKGKAFPSCKFSDSSGQETGTSSQHFAVNKSASKRFCHPDYLVPAEDRRDAYCLMKGAITVTVNGAKTQRIWWNNSGESITESSFELADPNEGGRPGRTGQIEP
jgi:hypothetical protein